MKTGFIGGGNMAQALMGGLVAKSVPASFVVVEPNATTRDTVARVVRGATLIDEPTAALADCDVVVLAVKPQQLRDAVGAAAPWLRGPVVLSIAAGIRTAEIARWSGTTRIVRAMPNTPALIGEGISGVYATDAVDTKGRDLAETLLRAVGRVLWVGTEDMIDAVTAVSGSGPAYVFAFIEALQRGARELGFDEDAARELAVTTFVGASRLAAQSEEPIAVLRERVTSKGGTTAAALAHLEANACSTHIVEAIHAAAKRSVELGGESGKEA